MNPCRELAEESTDEDDNVVGDEGASHAGLIGRTLSQDLLRRHPCSAIIQQERVRV